MYDKVAIIFNLTRLYSRLEQKKPTGVDRLDIRYAQYVLNKADNNIVCFVRQRKEILVIIPKSEAEVIIHFLWSAWVDHKELETPNAKSVFKRYSENVSVYLRRKRKNIIPKELPLQFKGFEGRVLYLNAGHAGVQYYSTHKQLKNELSCELVFYLHDLIPIDYPEYCTDPKVKDTHELRMEVLSELADLVVVNSEYTKNRFERYCTETNSQEPRIEIDYIGIEESILNASKAPRKTLLDPFKSKLEGADYYIFVSTIEPRKNHWMLLQVWLELTKVSNDIPKLVILGKRGWRNQNVTDLLDYSIKLRGHVIEVNLASDDEMISLIQNAKAMLFPSIDEGWGMPVAESLTLNTPVICSDIPVLRECGQGQCTYINPIDTKAWFNSVSIGKACDDINYVPNTWEQHFLKLNTLLGVG